MSDTPNTDYLIQLACLAGLQEEDYFEVTPLSTHEYRFKSFSFEPDTDLQAPSPHSDRYHRFTLRFGKMPKEVMCGGVVEREVIARLDHDHARVVRLSRKDATETWVHTEVWGSEKEEHNVLGVLTRWHQQALQLRPTEGTLAKDMCDHALYEAINKMREYSIRELPKKLSLEDACEVLHTFHRAVNWTRQANKLVVNLWTGLDLVG